MVFFGGGPPCGAGHGADENRRELIAIGGGAKLGSLQSIPFRYYAGNTLFETAYVSLWTRERERERE